MPKNRTMGRWSVRPSESTHGTAWTVYPKGERSHQAARAHLYPASDGRSYVISMNYRPLDARPTLDEALAAVMGALED